MFLNRSLGSHYLIGRVGDLAVAGQNVSEKLSGFFIGLEDFRGRLIAGFRSDFLIDILNYRFLNDVVMVKLVDVGSHDVIPSSVVLAVQKTLLNKRGYRISGKNVTGILKTKTKPVPQ